MDCKINSLENLSEEQSKRKALIGQIINNDFERHNKVFQSLAKTNISLLNNLTSILNEDKELLKKLTQESNKV